MRTFDASFLNAVANHPEVRPWLGGAGEIDLRAVIDNPVNVAFQTDAGGFVVIKLDDCGLYECHSLFLPDARETTAATMRESLRYMFCETDCAEIVTKIPEANRGALGLARAGGFRALFERDEAWDMPDGAHCRVAYASLPFARWVATDPDISGYGKWFHTRLEELTAGKIPEHKDEDIHNRMVGAAVLMLRARNTLKAVGFYNRWAMFAGYPPVKLLSQQPPIIDMDQVIVALKGDDMEVVKCRLD